MVYLTLDGFVVKTSRQHLVYNALSLPLALFRCLFCSFRFSSTSPPSPPSTLCWNTFSKHEMQTMYMCYRLYCILSKLARVSLLHFQGSNKWQCETHKIIYQIELFTLQTKIFICSQVRFHVQTHKLLERTHKLIYLIWLNMLRSALKKKLCLPCCNNASKAINCKYAIFITVFDNFVA